MVRREIADELALIAEQIGAEAIRGSVRYPGCGGGPGARVPDIEGAGCGTVVSKPQHFTLSTAESTRFAEAVSLRR